MPIGTPSVGKVLAIVSELCVSSERSKGEECEIDRGEGGRNKERLKKWLNKGSPAKS